MERKQRFSCRGVSRRVLSLVLAFVMLLSLASGLPGTLTAKAAEPATIRVTDLVQVKVGDELTTMELYQGGIYEAAVPVSAGAATATLVINGTETEQTLTVAPEADTALYCRVRDGVLSVTEAKDMPTAALVGNFNGIEFVDGEGNRYDISAWNPSDANGELTYLGGGLFGRTFLFKTLADDVTVADGGYKVAFNDNWDWSTGDGNGNNIGLTIPAGTSSLTVLVDSINGRVHDSVRSGSFAVDRKSVV